MHILVCYDVSTITPDGRRRLRKVARLCKDYGQRVQQSVFECNVGDVQWATLRPALLSEFNPAEDSLRFYRLGEDPSRRAEHHGVKPSVDFEGPLIA
ncbi:CRISPR-associated endonuclease Cas2 [Paludisphaera mucosa]|uniref:CRISPR-associated endoribonuclease Cas2 n=1 Tax=Paludisphaera mucosa TaxID=3030827 RepID=A0ABT6F5H4_9BACT|nr:CRISPR-associated endonuclease Cas2 [Paludisphaera mucosa]MDG3002832.1 CRISPR-associated endonuclease Cas2 [Paludisphaera mucosa]